MLLKKITALFFMGALLGLTGCSGGGAEAPLDSSPPPRGLQSFKGVSATSLSLCTTEQCARMALGSATCSFNGQILLDGESVTAYYFQMDPDGTCASETRTCQNGSLSGSYIYSSCNHAKTSCRFNGQEIPDGGSVTAYLNSSGDTCVSEIRTCTEGVLSGSYSYASCTVNAPKSCLFNGQTIADGDVVIAYQNSSVPFGDVCQQEVRLCQDGNLLGSYQNASCTVDSPMACQFNGQTYPHGETVTAYQSSSVPFGEVCQSETRTCSNGSFSGSYSYASCAPEAPAGCLFNGRTLAHGERVLAFENSSVPYGNTCASEERVCENGSLSGSYTFPSCTPEMPKTCSFNGRTLASGEKVVAYLSSAVEYGGECQAQERMCDDGVLSGSYTFSSCSVGTPKSCSFNGQTVAHGETVTAYNQSSVNYGGSCESEPRTCDNGVLSGSYNYGSCEVGAPAACLFNGQTIAHGQTVQAFESSSVPFGQPCQAQERTCDNGALSGSFTYGSCTVGTPRSCLFNGQTIPHGGAIVAFNESTVPYGESCDGQTRRCEDGTLSGSYMFASCTVNPPPEDDDDEDDQHGGGSCHGGGGHHGGGHHHDPKPKSCLFHGRTIAHGESIIAYKEKNSCGGREQCLAQKRTCINGRLTGNYPEISCENGEKPHSRAVWLDRSKKCDRGSVCNIGVWHRHGQDRDGDKKRNRDDHHKNGRHH